MAYSPRLLPLTAIPKAKALLVEKYCDTMATLGKNSIPKPIPVVRPCERNTCQYLVHKLVINMPKTEKKAPRE